MVECPPLLPSTINITSTRIMIHLTTNTTCATNTIYYSYYCYYYCYCCYYYYDDHCYCD